MKSDFILRLLLVASSTVMARVIVNSSGGGKRRKHLSYDGGDYEASGDYFEALVSTTISSAEDQVTSTTEELRALTAATTLSSLVDDGSGAGSGDDGVVKFETTSDASLSSSSSTEGYEIDGSTCTPTSIRRLEDDEYQLSNHVLAIFKVNVSSNGRELYFFLHLAKRFNLSEIYRDVKFVIVCSDESSDDVIEYIVSENFPLETIVVVDDNDETAEKFGLPLEMEDLHVYIVDQCSNLAYIISPPWSSAKYPYVKAGLLSCYFDLPCGCPADEFTSSNPSGEMSSSTENRSTEADDEPKASIKDGMSDEDEDIENIEELLHNSNTLNGNLSTLAMEGLIPLRIVIPSMHVHYDNQTASYWLYEDIVIKSSARTSPYDHFHLKSGVRLLEVRRQRPANYNSSSSTAQNNNSKSISSVNLSKSASEMFVGNRTIKDIWTIAQSDQIFIDRNGRAYKIQKAIPAGFDVVRVDFDLVRLKPFRRNYGTQQHYEQLKKWTDAVI